MKDFIHSYNPANAGNLSDQDIAAMQELTDEQIKELAERYPNHGATNAYLILKDTSAKTQIYPVSTWVNLYNLRVKNGMKKYVAYTFKSLFIKRPAPAIPVQGKIQDLTQSEIENAEGIRKPGDRYIVKEPTEIDEAWAGVRLTNQVISDGLDEFPELEVPKRNKHGLKRKSTNNKK